MHICNDYDQTFTELDALEVHAAKTGHDETGY
jgi:hypothetical protein